MAAEQGHMAEDGASGSGLAEGLAALGRSRGLGTELADAVTRAGGEAAMLLAARRSGLACRRRRLTWDDLAKPAIGKPALVGFGDGRWLLLLAVEVMDGTAVARLADPRDPAASITVDRLRFTQAWTGDAVVVPPVRRARAPRAFGWRTVAGVVLEEPRLLRDAVAATLALGALAVVPILIVQLLLGRVLPGKATHTLVVLAIALLAAVLIEAALRGARGVLVTRLAAHTQARLADRLFARLLELPTATLDAMPVGEARQRFTELRTIGDTLASLLPRLGLDLAILAVFVPCLALLDPLLTAGGVAAGALLVAGLVALLPRLRRGGDRVAVARGHRDAFLVQTLLRMSAIKALALGHDRMAHWDRLTATLGKARLQEARLADTLQAAARPVERVLVLGALALGMALAGWRGDVVPVARLVTIVLMVQRLAEPLATIAALARAQAQARVAARRLGGLLNQEPEATAAYPGAGVVGPGRIVFDRVGFRYPGNDAEALRGVSFTVEPGTTLGILGRSGAGKTTIVRLLQRLHPAANGAVLIDGTDVRALAPWRLRRAVSVVPQTSTIFAGTIRDTITAAKPDASFAEVTRAATLAGADDFIERLPRGFDTMLHEGAPSLSSGQRQRLALARALITDPPILVLDEALSALDAEIGARVESQLRDARHGRTTIIIAHHPAALMNADAILILAKGVVQDCGTHADLMERCDAYRAAWGRHHDAPDHEAAPGEGLLAVC